MFATNLSILGVSAVADRQQDGHAVVRAAVAADDRRVRPVRARSATTTTTRRSRRGSAAHCTHSLEDKQSQPGTNGDREQPDPAHRRQHHLHAGSVRPGHHRQQRRLPDDRASTRGIKYRGLSLEGEYYWRWLTQLHRRQHRRHSRHHRQRLPAAVVGDGDQGRPAGLSERIADLRRLRRPVGDARRRRTGTS